MINGRRVLAIIPARGGSKGLPRKNIRPLAGKPLIAWTIEKALKCRHADVVMVTTDDPEIADIARQWGASVPFLRPDHLATDEAPTIDVVHHVLAHYGAVEATEFEYAVLMEPTSPLREDDDVDRMLCTLDNERHRFDAIVSVGKVNEHPSIMKRVSAEGIAPFCPGITQTTRRQDSEPAYFPYGVAYVAKTCTLLEERTFYSRRCTSFIIKRYQNYEIDDEYDLLCVERVLRHEWGMA